MFDQTSHDSAAAPRIGAAITQQKLVANSVVAREQARVTCEESTVLRAKAVETVRESEALVHQIETLTQALETRTQIATAVGMLMAREGVSNEEAFSIL